MSKLSFRAKALDPSKPMPVFVGDEVPELPDFSAVNRTVPEMPTGMEKEEETEHHLQRALSAQQVYGSSEVLVIPIPDMDLVEDRYKKLYHGDTANFKLPKQYIHVQPWGMDQEIPEYDMDSEDEHWLNREIKNLKMEVKPVKFENMMDRLEKGSGQMVVTLSEAKALLKEDDDLIMAVYDYWLNKRLRLAHSLIPQVKTERRDGSTTNNPYVAFRRRAEKMQTRKNRKNDETSYEKMLKLRKDLNRALLIIEMLKRRDKSKKELLNLTVEVAEKRYELEDWNGKLLEEANAQKDLLPPSFTPFSTPYSIKPEWTMTKEDGMLARKTRVYKKRKHKTSRVAKPLPPSSSSLPPLYAATVDDRLAPATRSVCIDDDEGILSGSSDEDGESDPDRIYSFHRKHGCAYHAPRQAGIDDSWPWCAREQGGEKRYKYSLASLGQRPNCVGYARRRVGRGGRVIFDRAFTQWDDSLQKVDWTIKNAEFTSDYNKHLRRQDMSQRYDGCHGEPLTAMTSCTSPAFSSSLSDCVALTTCNQGNRGNKRLINAGINNACDYRDISSDLTNHLMPTIFDDRVSVTTRHFDAVASTQSDLDLITTSSSKSLLLIDTSSSSKANGLSTLPAANILQLNFPIVANKLTTHELTTVNALPSQTTTSRSCTSTPTATTSASNCKIIRTLTPLLTPSLVSSGVAKGVAVGVQRFTTVQNVTNVANFLPRPTNKISSVASRLVVGNNIDMTMTSSSTSGLVPVLKLTGASRNDNQPRETHETLNHIAKDTTIVAMEVT